MTEVAPGREHISGAGEDERGLKDWYGKFLQWMLDSKNGREDKSGE